jgi:hypothetical protein
MLMNNTVSDSLHADKTALSLSKPKTQSEVGQQMGGRFELSYYLALLVAYLIFVRLYWKAPTSDAA